MDLVYMRPERLVNKQSTTSSRTTQPGHYVAAIARVEHHREEPTRPCFHRSSYSQMTGHSSRAVTKHRARQSPSHDNKPKSRERVRFSDTPTGMLPGIPGPQCAFENWMIRKVSQFALRIAIRCVLHRCGSQDIHCRKVL
jgi:hypothetical protein